MFPCRAGSCRHRIGELPCTDLFAEHEEAAVEECFVELNETLQDVRLVGEVRPELIEPVTYGLIGELGEAHGLPDRDLGGPAPEDDPELHEWQLHVGEPGVGEDTEALATISAAIPILLGDDLPGPTPRTEHVLAKELTPEKLPNLRLRRYLIEWVHISHGMRYVTTGSYCPREEKNIHLLK